VRPAVRFTVLEWASETEVVKVRVIGTDQNGKEINSDVVFPEPMTIDEVHGVLSKVNNGVTRPPV
jgi:hypothetical protein